MNKQLMKGNEAIAEAAIRVGAKHYFAYPITPQNEVAEYLSKRMPEVGGVFVQAESEVAASNMLFGAAASGKRCFTTSSSPGISLMQEAISYMAGAQVPVVIINIVRGGPGLGGILPAQSDYFQSTKGGGHGDYRLLVLAPSSVQEAVDLVQQAFPLAEKYRCLVMIIGDGMIGQMMEPVSFSETMISEKEEPPDWAVGVIKDNRPPRIVKSLFLDPLALEKNNLELKAKYQQMAAAEIRYEEYLLNDKSELLIVAYGTMARICKTVIDDLKEEGKNIALLRPITLFPFPQKRLRQLAEKTNLKNFLTVEMSCGQMVEDVEYAVLGKKPVHFYGRTGGIVPTPEEVKEKISQILS